MAAQFVLIVDDDSDFLDLFKLKLKKFGYTNVHSATNGSEALDTLKQHQNDIALVITDCMMPEMDGLTLKERMLTDLPGFGAPVLVLSGYGTEALRDLATTLGVERWLEKPLDDKTLIKILEQYLPK